MVSFYGRSVLRVIILYGIVMQPSPISNFVISHFIAREIENKRVFHIVSGKGELLFEAMILLSNE